LCNHSGWLDRFETAGLDAFNLLQTSRDPNHVTIVGVDDDDYRSIFGNKSPLDADKLMELIASVAAGKPSLIGVDFDTSSTNQSYVIPPDWPPLIWAQDAIEIEGKLQPLPPLGGGPIRLGDDVGIAVLPLDPDGIVRRYRRYFDLGAERKSQSFPRAVVRAYCKLASSECPALASESSEHRSNDLLLNFSGERFNFSPVSARHILSVADEPAWRENGPIRNRIVLIGGVYRAGRDAQVTPVGRMSGVQLMAQAIESELSGGGVRAVNEILAIVLEVLSGAVVVWIGYRFELGTAVVLIFLAIPLLSLCSSFLAFSSFSRWFNFAPLVVSVLVHELYHHARRYRMLIRSQEGGHGKGI
jgi:CHASE2 domain-containing sensor protein